MFESPELENTSVDAHRPVATREASSPGMSALQGGQAAMLALQRSAGNAAVSRLVGAGGADPITVQRTPDADAPELPITGDASFMLLDKERYFPIDLPDLDE